MFRSLRRKVPSNLWNMILLSLLSVSRGLSQDPSDEKKDALKRETLTNKEETSSSKEALPGADYVIKPGDVVDVFVWREHELSRKAPVRGDGKITIPLVQDVQAAGLTPSELKKSLEERLTKFIEAPNVTISLDSISLSGPEARIPVFLVGKVNRPGPILVQKPIDVLQILSLVGGFQEFASVKKIIIVRNNGGEKTVLHFNYNDVINGKHLEQNVQLEAGDMIVVP